VIKYNSTFLNFNNLQPTCFDAHKPEPLKLITGAKMSDSPFRFSALLAHISASNLGDPSTSPQPPPPSPHKPTPESQLIAIACCMWCLEKCQDLGQNDGHDQETALEEDIRLFLSGYGEIPQNQPPDSAWTSLFEIFAARLEERRGFRTRFEAFVWVNCGHFLWDED